MLFGWGGEALDPFILLHHKITAQSKVIVIIAIMITESPWVKCYSKDTVNIQINAVKAGT